jgi:hypothetical protein
VLNVVRSAAPASSTSYFLGVRLTTEEVEALDRFQRDGGISTRSDAVRALVRRAGQISPKGPEFPVSLRVELEDLVEDGWANTLDEALTLVATLGLNELSRVHAERVPSLRRAAREAGDRARNRRRVDREGRGLLER